jgi:hypothetical protein
MNRDAAGALIVGFTPLAATIAAGADLVMSAHIVFSGYDDAPATPGRIAALCGRVILPGLLVEAAWLEFVIRRNCRPARARPSTRCCGTTCARGRRTRGASRGSVLPEITCLLP